MDLTSKMKKKFGCIGTLLVVGGLTNCASTGSAAALDGQDLDTLARRVDQAFQQEIQKLETEVREKEVAERWAEWRFASRTAERERFEGRLRDAHRAERDLRSSRVSTYELSTAEIADEVFDRRLVERELESAREKEAGARADLQGRTEERRAAEQTARQKQAELRNLHLEAERHRQEFRDSPSPESRDRSFESNRRLATHLGVVSRVTWRTKPDPGAIVYYVTKHGREVGDSAKSLNSLTPCTQDLPIGNYYFWTEREGVVTSDRNRPFKIVDEVETVEIPESRPHDGT